METTTIGLDLGKNVFQVHGVNERGHRCWNWMLLPPQPTQRTLFPGDIQNWYPPILELLDRLVPLRMSLASTAKAARTRR